jgi:type IV conjugative transfer system protein TraL
LIIGIGIGYGITGFFASIFGFWALRKIKKHFGVGNLRQLAYWYFPHNYKKLKNTPPSYVREYLT